MSGPIKNYTTGIAALRSVAEMQALLAAHGAQRVAVDYIEGEPSGLSFALETPHGMRVFVLPVDIDRMWELLVKQGKAGKLGSLPKNRWSSREHAERVAWRVMKDWLSAQLTLLATTMVTMDELMLPYLKVDNERTLYRAYSESESKALESVR